MPTEAGMASPRDALRENEVDDEEEDYPGGDEDHGRDSQSDLCRTCCPSYPKDAGHRSSHAESKTHPGHEKFVTLSFIHLEDSHVSGGANQEEDEENGCDGDVNGGRGYSAERGCHRGIWAMLRRRLIDHQSLLLGVCVRTTTSLTLPSGGIATVMIERPRRGLRWWLQISRKNVEVGGSCAVWYFLRPCLGQIKGRRWN